MALEEFDVIFAGGGTTACVIAGRLVAADPSLKILVVENGQHSKNIPSVVQPCRFVENLVPDTHLLSFHVAKPNANLNWRSPVAPHGQSVGGGSCVNFMLYVRGAASDYDNWAALDNKGWSFDEVLPLIKKIETFAPLPHRNTHGYSGLIQVSAADADFGIGNQFLDVGRAYDPSRPQVDDNNDFKTANAYSPAYKYVDPVTGKRSDSASRYLYPHTGNPNLKIIVRKCVKRVIIENGRAVGIEYMTNTALDQEGSSDLVVAKATKLVIVSAGALGSPAILERSGIGAVSILQKNNIDIVVDLPGVGENYQNHLCSCPLFYTSDKTETMNDVWSDPEAVIGYMKEWEDNGTGKIAHNGVEALVKVRLTALQLMSSGPMVQSRWNTFFENHPDKPMGIITTFSGFPWVRYLSLDRDTFSLVCYALYPQSIGTVHITSGEDVNAPLDFDPNFFSVACDVAELSLLYKMARELARRMPAYRGEVPSEHPKFPHGSSAACGKVDGPVAIDAPDIIYTSEDDAAIEKFLRNTALPISHSLGTCAMKPRDQGGVVDARLNVYGVEGLKIADMSICPTNVGNNTHSTALLIGEKAAVIIAEDLGVEM